MLSPAAERARLIRAQAAEMAATAAAEAAVAALGSELAEATEQLVANSRYRGAGCAAAPLLTKGPAPSDGKG